VHDNTYDTFAEFDIGKPPIGVEMKTEIFISKEKVSDGQTLDLKIIYTPYKGISHFLYIYIKDT